MIRAWKGVRMERGVGRGAVIVQLVVVVTLTGVLAGCGGSVSGSGSVPVDASSPSASGSGAAGSGTAGSGAASPGRTARQDAWLTFERTGGIAGMQDLVVVAPDGTVTVTTRSVQGRTSRLSAQELRQLRALVDAARLEAPPSASGTGGVNDAFSYRIGVDGREVEYTDGSIPRPVAPLLAALTALISGS